MARKIKRQAKRDAGVLPLYKKFKNKYGVALNKKAKKAGK